MFRENNIEAERVNYFNEPLTAKKLRDLIAKADLKPFDFLRKGEAIFKELNLTKDNSDNEIIEAMIKYPSLLQRPIVEIGEKAVLARPIEKALQIIK